MAAYHLTEFREQDTPCIYSTTTMHRYQCVCTEKARERERTENGKTRRNDVFLHHTSIHWKLIHIPNVLHTHTRARKANRFTNATM